MTVGLSTTIPLSLIGQIFLNEQHASFVYWLGACIVLLSFFFVNHEEGKEDDGSVVHDEEQVALEEPPVVMEP